MHRRPSLPPMVRARTAGATVLLLLVGATFLALPEAFAEPPAHRNIGPRLPRFSGGDPRARRLVKVSDLLWIGAQHEAAWKRGEAWNGRRYIPRTRPPSGAPDVGAYRLRTDHVFLRTNVPFADAERIARAAEIHARRLVMTWGDALDLRLPNGPLQVVATATRREFAERLRKAVGRETGWGAFYDARTGVVHVCLEPKATGALPWIADLRHEMTHQILDLSRPPSRRGRPFGMGWFWLWEGIALHAETMGDPAGTDSAAQRMVRFRRRLAARDTTPWRDLRRLDGKTFLGRHYDQTAAMMRFLLSADDPARQRGTVGLLARLMQGPVPPDQFARYLGGTPQALERAWLRSLGR